MTTAVAVVAPAHGQLPVHHHFDGTTPGLSFGISVDAAGTAATPAELRVAALDGIVFRAQAVAGSGEPSFSNALRILLSH
jgi:hypothetical protein